MKTEEIKTELTLPAHLSFLSLALSFIEESAKTLPFSDDEINKIRLASEEAVSNVIEHGLSNDIYETFRIACIGKPHQIEIRIYEKGKPFDPANIPSYDPDKTDMNISTAGLGTFLMKSVMDEVHFNNLGREGKETVLVKYISRGRPDFESLTKESDYTAENFTFTIRDFKESDAQQISECAYSAYGYSYEPYIYYPAKIIQMNRDRKIVSLVAESDTGKIIAHMAYKFSNNPSSAELGVAFVDPAYRGHNIFKEMSDNMILNAHKISGLKSLYVSCVTGHPGSQKNIYKAGFKPTSLMLALLPADVNFKDLTGEVPQKESALLASGNISAHDSQTIYMPEEHTAIIREILDNAEIKYTKGTPDEILTGDEQDEIFTSVVVECLNIGVIYCQAYTAETPSALKHKLNEMCMDQLSAVFLYLEMSEPSAPLIADRCSEMGFLFCGVQPFGQNGNHSLILQYLNNVRLDFSKINLADPFSYKLRDYIEKMYTSKL